MINKNYLLYPKLNHELLLKSIFLEKEKAITAWNNWRDNADFNNLDKASFMLLPLLYKKLGQLRIDDINILKMKGIHRSTWYNNNTIFHSISKIIEIFNINGIQTILIKGTALAYYYYEDIGLRPTGDIDILIWQEDLHQAIGLLQKAGWYKKKYTHTFDSLSNSNIPLKNAIAFNNSIGQGLDLHWYLLPECCNSDMEDTLWERAKEVTFYEIPTKILSSSDLLFHACIQANRYEKNYTPIRYLADIITLLNTDYSNLNWHHIIASAIKQQMILPVRNVLNYLNHELCPSIPLAILNDINIRKAGKIDIISNKVRSRPSILGSLSRYWVNYLYYSFSVSKKLNLLDFIGFFKYMKLIWGLKYTWQVPLTMFLKFINRLLNIYRVKTSHVFYTNID